MILTVRLIPVMWHRKAQRSNKLAWQNTCGKPQQQGEGKSEGGKDSDRSGFQAKIQSTTLPRKKTRGTYS